MLNFRSHRDSGASERGSVLIAVMVIFIAMVAMGATLTAVSNGLSTVRHDQNRVNAFQFANAGIDQATYRIDDRQLPTTASGNYTPTLTAGVVTGFTDKVTVNGSTFKVTAIYSATSEWTVTSVGTDSSKTQREVVASIQDTPIFTNAFFAIQTFSLTGNQSSPTWYQSSLCATLTNVSACELPDRRSRAPRAPTAPSAVQVFPTSPASGRASPCTGGPRWPRPKAPVPAARPPKCSTTPTHWSTPFSRLQPRR